MQTPLQKPSSDVSHSLSIPLTAFPARFVWDKLAVQPSTPNIHSQSYDPRQSTHPREPGGETPEVHKPRNRDPSRSHNQQSLGPVGPNQACTLYGAQPGSSVVSGADYVKAAFVLNVDDLWRRNFIVIVCWFFFFIIAQVVVIEYLQVRHSVPSSFLRWGI